MEMLVLLAGVEWLPKVACNRFNLRIFSFFIWEENEHGDLICIPGDPASIY